MKYRFMAVHQDQFEVKIMCQVLAVSSSAYYAWKQRPLSQRALVNQQLVAKIRAIHAHSRQTYGSPRIHAELRDQGIVCNHKRVARLMRHHSIQPKQRKRYKITTNSKHKLAVAPNRLDRQFQASRPNEKWVADISYIDTDEGWLYLATVLDLFSRKIVGWSMSNRITATLVEDALLLALGRRVVTDELLHHSDRGSQYASQDYQQLLQQHGITVSMSNKGDCYDNAVMESFFATLKTECATQRYATRAQARQAIFEYIENWYNRQRRHSTLGYLSPVAFEQLHD